MNAKERAGFIERLKATAGLVGRRLPDDTAAIYANVCDDIAYDRLKLSLERWARSAESASKFPMPKELRALATGGGTARDAATALRRQLESVKTRRQWLEGGKPLTSTSMAAILDDVAAQPLPTVESPTDGCHPDVHWPNVHPNIAALKQRDGGARVRWMRDLAADLRAGKSPQGMQPLHAIIGRVLGKGAIRDRDPGEEG
jgi:hypothetical protein